jgi:hypothetical protein
MHCNVYEVEGREANTWDGDLTTETQRHKAAEPQTRLNELNGYMSYIKKNLEDENEDEAICVSWASFWDDSTGKKKKCRDLFLCFRG